jgi:hypothetical protein
MTSLRAVTAEDGGWIAEVVTGWPCSHRWSLRGQTPSPQLLGHLLWNGVLKQYVIAEGSGAQGLVQLYDGDLHNGVGHLGLLLRPGEPERHRPVIEAFVEECFRDFPLRKICVEVVADDGIEPTTVGSDLRLAGRLADHERRTEDTFADLLLYELWRA